MKQKKDFKRIQKVFIKEFKIPYQYQNIILLAIKEGYTLSRIEELERNLLRSKK